MSWADNREYYGKRLAEVEPDVILTDKDHWFWAAAWWVLVICTFGLFALGMSRKRFLEQYTTTLALVMAVPRQYFGINLRLATHELAGHGAQFIFAGWFAPIVGWFFGRRVRAFAGLLPMALVYGLLPLPAGLCYGRYRLELEADIVSWRWALQSGYWGPLGILNHAFTRIDKVSGGAYFWPWPKPWVRKGYLAAAKRVIKEYEDARI